MREIREGWGSVGADAAEEGKAIERVRELYERAVAMVPPDGEKRYWRRYIFLWLDYALFEEIETKVRFLLMHFTRFSFEMPRNRITSVPAKSTIRLCQLCRTSSSRLLNYGSFLHNLRYGGLTFLPLGKFWVLP